MDTIGTQSIQETATEILGRHPGAIPSDTVTRHLIGEARDGQGIFLVDGDLTETVYEQVVDEANAHGLGTRYHVYSRLTLIITDDVTWHQTSNGRPTGTTLGTPYA
jgi:hypothetical protein